MEEKKPKNKVLWRWVKIIVLLYCSIGIALYYLQDKFLFHPKALPTNHVYSFDVPFKEVNIAFNKEDTLNMIQFFPADSIPKGVVIYFHGNRDNVERYAQYAKTFTRYGYEVWMPDYPGFGKSRGERTEKQMYEMMWQVRKMAANKYPPEKVILYGKSFGTGLASYVSTVSKNKLLILETPYYSIPDLFHSFSLIYPSKAMANYQIPVYQYLTEANTPIIIFHGTKDEVIFYSRASKLKKFLKSTDRFITIAGGKHNHLDTFALYKNTIDSLFRN